MDLNIKEPSRYRSDSSYEHSHQDLHYSKCSKTSNTFLFLFSNEMLFFMTGILKMVVRIANREDPDQIESEEAV